MKNFKKLRSHIIPTILVSLFFISSTNKGFAAGENNEPPWYEVEVILFTHSQKQGMDSESWPENTAESNYNQVVDLALPGKIPDQTPLPPFTDELNNTPIVDAAELYANNAHVLLGKESLQMRNMAKKIASSRDYDLLLHIAWRQPTFSQKESLPVFVFDDMLKPTPKKSRRTPAGFEQLESYGPQYYLLSGTLKLSVSRYLHLESDIHLKTPTTIQDVLVEAQPTESQGEGINFGSFFGVSQEPTPITIERKILRNYRMFESRRMRSKEIHFFDHPMFGLIVKVTPFELPSAAEPVISSKPPINQ